MAITRRDFLDGVALGVVAGLSPLQLLAAQGPGGVAPYPPALTGLRGSHAGAFELAHEIGREHKVFETDHLPVSEACDLVVVGGGISGLSAAWFYRDRHPGARILVLENHDDFGGHARRNEFQVGDRFILGYGGSESLQSPRQLYSAEAHYLLARLGVSIGRLEAAFNRDFYPDLGLSRGVFFDREHFGVDKLVAGDPGRQVSDDIAPERLNGRPWRAFIGDFPLPEADRAALIALHEAPRDYLADRTRAQKQDYLSKVSYRAFLLRDVGLSPAAARCFQGRTHDFLALGIDAVAAWDAYELGYPGFDAMDLEPPSDAAQAEMEAPYIHHFPDGNASIARLLVRSLVPAVAPPVAPGREMDDLVLARFDYGRLDAPDANVRIRLNSTVVSVKNRAGGVDVGYGRSGRLERVRARHCVLACWNMMIPHILRGLPARQAQALSRNVKFPLVYAKVVLRDWQSLLRLGVHEICAPTSPYARVKLDYPVDLGGYRHPRDPGQPIGLHMVHVPAVPDAGLDARGQARAGRLQLLATPFEQLEQQIREQLQRMLGPAGFDHGRDILAITVNRWSHGYSDFVNSLFDDEDEYAGIIAAARAPGARDDRELGCRLGRLPAHRHRRGGAGRAGAAGLTRCRAPGVCKKGPKAFRCFRTSTGQVRRRHGRAAAAFRRPYGGRCPAGGAILVKFS